MSRIKVSTLVGGVIRGIQQFYRGRGVPSSAVGSLVPRPHPAHARRRGLVSQVEILGLAPETWPERPMKSQSSVYWNNAEARTSTSIVPLKVML